jgi:Glycosyltransferases involved in cell wall biogenesis
MQIQPLISVIVPVYKAEEFLPKCINSILSQTYTNFELLLIDDGSPDNSGKICDEHASKDSRVRVFHKQNGGVSSARNLGLREARGEWISWVDADDWIEKTCWN